MLAGVARGFPLHHTRYRFDRCLQLPALQRLQRCAIDQMVRVMSKELAAKGIMVNSVAPGPKGRGLFSKGEVGADVKGHRGRESSGEAW